MRRELAEEVAIDTPYTERCVGLINDDESEVGRVHLGVVHMFDVDRPSVRPLETDIIEAGFRPLDEILADTSRLRNLVADLPEGTVRRSSAAAVAMQTACSLQHRLQSRCWPRAEPAAKSSGTNTASAKVQEYSGSSGMSVGRAIQVGQRLVLGRGHRVGALRNLARAGIVGRATNRRTARAACR